MIGRLRGATGLGTLTLSLTCLLWSVRTEAGDPDLTWYTLRSPHFRIHFHDGEAELSQRLGRIAEQALSRLGKAIGSLPSNPIELVLSDVVDTANGSATVLPYNLLHVYASPPGDLSELNDYDDHLQILVLHELTHLFHMDQVSGLPLWINRVFGRTVYPNGAQPVWFTEGLAVHFESTLSSAGRLRSSLYRMMLRTAALADGLPSLDRMTGALRDWPQGNAPYLYGAFFVSELARRYGQEAVLELVREMSGMLIPWSLNTIARDVLGRDYPTLYEGWRRTVEDEARETLAALQREGLTPIRRLTHRAWYQLAPRIHPDGRRLVYFSAPADDRASLRLMDLTTGRERELLEVSGAGGAAFTPDGRQLVFSQPEIMAGAYVYDDLFRLDLDSGRQERLTVGLRAREPDVSPDGRSVVFVRNRTARNALGWLDLISGETRLLTSWQDGGLHTPRFSPDGTQIVYSAQRPGGGRNLVVLDLASGSRRQLTDGDWLDIEPVFTPDGRSVIFASDRGGIYNLYTLDPADAHVRRLTNTVTGVFQPEPAPDGKALALVVYGPGGYDLAWMDWPRTDYSVPTSPARPPTPYTDETAVYPVSDYRPWSALLPRSWFPLLGADAWGSTYGILFGGSDPVGKLYYQAALSFGPGNNQVYADLGLGFDLFYPNGALYFSRHVDHLPAGAFLGGRAYGIDRQEITLNASLAFPFSSLKLGQALYLDYDLHLFDRWTELAFDPLDPSPVLPDDRRLAWFGLGWSVSRLRRYPQSISTAEGVSASVSLRASHPFLGSGSRLFEMRVWLRGYLPIVRRWHHVLALGLQAGAAFGDPRRRALFSVGGLPLRDPLLDSYFGYRYGGLYLRGYDPGAFAGSAYALASIEYRLPVWCIERGLWTLPFYLRTLHAAAFLDVGGSSPEPAFGSLVHDFLKVGVGIEVRLDLLLAYYLPFTIRFGYGRGLSSGGVNNFYLTLGSGF